MTRSLFRTFDPPPYKITYSAKHNNNNEHLQNAFTKVDCFKNNRNNNQSEIADFQKSNFFKIGF